MRGNWKLYMCILAAVLLTVPLSAGIHREAAGRQSPVNNDREETPDGCTVPGETPQVEDRVRDVKILGLLPIFPQWYLRHVDIVSTTFYEESDTPALLYLSLELRDLQTATAHFEAVYSIGWSFDDTYYRTGILVRPDGPLDFTVARSIDGDDDVEQREFCEGTFDVENNVLTWEIPKTAVGDPSQGSRLYNIHPNALLRPTGRSLLPPVDLFKDLVNNAKTTGDYTIKY